MNYDFRNKDTGEIITLSMRLSELDIYLADNPLMERYHSIENLPIFGDGLRMNTPGAGQPDSTFEKYVINRIKETIPGNTVKAGHKTKMPREW